MRSDGAGGPDEDGTVRRDIAYRLLATAVAMMRPRRRDWGRAMLVELEHVRSPGDRARFALGATRVALFPPRASRPWWGVPLGLALRAAVAAEVVHALAPAVGPAPLALMVVPAAGAWGVVTVPAQGAHPGGVVSVGQAAVAAGVTGFLALALVTVQRYPQVMSTNGDHGWGIGVVFDVFAAGYLGVAWLLSRRCQVARRNTWYALAAALVVAAAAAYSVAHSSLVGVDEGTTPLEYLLACLAVPAATALAAGRRGRIEDGLEAAAWVTLLSALITSIMIVAGTNRVSAAAWDSRPIIADAHQHGVASASVWLAGDNLGGAIFMPIWVAVIFLVVAVAGAAIGCVLRGLVSRATR